MHLLYVGSKLGEAGAQTLDWLQSCQWRQLPATCCNSLDAAELGNETGVIVASRVAVQAAADPGMRDPTRWWLGAQEVGHLPPAKGYLANDLQTESGVMPCGAHLNLPHSRQAHLHATRDALALMAASRRCKCSTMALLQCVPLLPAPQT